MTEQALHQQNQFEAFIQEMEQTKQPLTSDSLPSNKARSLSDSDNEEQVIESPFRFSDPTIIDRGRIVGFKKTGQLLKRMKRELSYKEKQKPINKNTDREIFVRDFPNITACNCNKTDWQQKQRDQIMEAMVNQYQKNILTLKAQLNDLKEERKEMKENLENQRRLFMSEMYSKELILQQNQLQIQKLKTQIQKHTAFEFKLQQRIRLLELQNTQYQYQLESEVLSYDINLDQMQPIHEQNEDHCHNSINFCHKKQTNNVSMSLNSHVDNDDAQINQDRVELMRRAHQKEILKYEKEIKNIREFYEIKLRACRRLITPQVTKPRNSINVLDQYICRDSLESQYRPQILRNALREQMSCAKSGVKIDDNQSFVTVKHFMYPQSVNKNLNGEDLFIREPEECQQVKEKVEFQEQTEKQVKQDKETKDSMPSVSFVKGFLLGGFILGASTLFFCRRWFRV